MQIILQNHTYFSTFCSKNSSLMPSNCTQRLFESVRTYVRITASIQSPKVRHDWGAGGTYECLNCTKLQVVAALTAQICKKSATPM